MQTFHSTAHSSATAAVIHSMVTLFSSAAASPRVPILPDNYSVAHGAAGGPSPSETPAVSIIAADPSNVLPGAPLLAVEGLGLDGVELKFVNEDHHNSQARTDDHGGGMILDMWKAWLTKSCDVTNKRLKP